VNLGPVRCTLQTALTIALALWALPLYAQSTGEVAAVKSRTLRMYNDVLTGFSVEARARVVEYDMAGDLERGKTIFRQIRSRRPALILAIGTEAATLAAREVNDIPILFCMVPNLEKYEFTSPNITGISLDLPIRTQLATLQTIAPRTRNVGVMYNPKYSHKIIEEAFQAADKLGMALIPSKIDSPEDVPRGTRAFLGRVDALWMVADPTLMNSRAFRSLVDFTRQNRVPLFSISEKMVKAGALVSLAAHPYSIGQQAGRMANKILRQGVTPDLIPVEAPEGLEIAINLATAKGIGVECDIALEVFTFAARNGYRISVHE